MTVLQNWKLEKPSSYLFIQSSMLSVHLQYGRYWEYQCCVQSASSWIKMSSAQVDEKCGVFFEQGMCLSLIGLPMLCRSCQTPPRREVKEEWSELPGAPLEGTNMESELQRLRPCFISSFLHSLWTVWGPSNLGAGHASWWRRCWEDLWVTPIRDSLGLTKGFSNMQIPQRTVRELGLAEPWDRGICLQGLCTKFTGPQV